MTCFEVAVEVALLCRLTMGGREDPPLEPVPAPMPPALMRGETGISTCEVGAMFSFVWILFSDPKVGMVSRGELVASRCRSDQIRSDVESAGRVACACVWKVQLQLQRACVARQGEQRGRRDPGRCCRGTAG